jgi:adenylylsulfate kinase-like enzyme
MGIYWFTGQPGHGKTVLAKSLKEYIEYNYPHKKVFHVDGDDLRDLLVNKDYSRQGRENNIRTAQSIALYLYNNGYDVVVSLVSPYKELREEFKSRTNVTEIYVHTTEERGREEFHVNEYEPPTDNFIDMDTTDDVPNASLVYLLNCLKL